MSYNLSTNNLRTHFAKISSSKCFLGDFSKNKQIFLPPAPAFRITVPNGLRIIISVLYYQHNAECCVFILVRLWWRVAGKLVQYEYPHKTAQFCLTGVNWQKWKRVFLTCPCHEIYRDEAVGLKSCKNTWKITIFVKMWNLGQYRQNLIFCQ